MLCLETAVPVHARVVEAELAVLLVLDDVQIVLTGEQLEGERAEFAVRAHVLGLADDGADVGVLVQQNLGKQVLVRQVLLAEVKVRYFISLSLT